MADPLPQDLPDRTGNSSDGSADFVPRPGSNESRSSSSGRTGSSSSDEFEENPLEGAPGLYPEMAHTPSVFQQPYACRACHRTGGMGQVVSYCRYGCTCICIVCWNDPRLLRYLIGDDSTRICLQCGRPNTNGYHHVAFARMPWYGEYWRHRGQGGRRRDSVRQAAVSVWLSMGQTHPRLRDLEMRVSRLRTQYGLREPWQLLFNAMQMREIRTIFDANIGELTLRAVPRPRNAQAAASHVRSLTVRPPSLEDLVQVIGNAVEHMHYWDPQLRLALWTGNWHPERIVARARLRETREAQWQRLRDRFQEMQRQVGAVFPFVRRRERQRQARSSSSDDDPADVVPCVLVPRTILTHRQHRNAPS
jgi:hypothetical protein